METIESIKTRRSVRQFADKPLESEKLQQLLEAVRRAPTWANLQCCRMVVVQDKEVQNRISELSYVEEFFSPLGYKSNPARKGLAEAPAVIVLCADPEKSGTLWGQNYYLVDAGIASQNLMLAAHALGLGTVFVGVFDEAMLRELLRIPPEIRIVGLFPIGYPRDEAKGEVPRKPLEEIVYYGTWK